MADGEKMTDVDEGDVDAANRALEPELQAPDYAGEEGQTEETTEGDEVYRSGLERAGRDAEEKGPVGPIEETLPGRP